MTLKRVYLQMSVMKCVCIFCLLGVLLMAMIAVGLLSCLWWLQTSGEPPPLATPPHIVIILADDLGWNDVSFHGSDQFQTPNIDALAYSGVILHDYYTQPICTPSRAALLTGRHPIHTGMEHDVIYASQPWGLPLSERILPQYLRPLGYESRAVGKWHLGFFRSNYTPGRRGFDSHYGMWLGHQDHYSHMGYEAHPGYDFHRELDVEWAARGRYSADLFTAEAEAIIRDHNDSHPLFLYLAHTSPHAPLQAPPELIQRFSYIANKDRQKFAAMVTALDESVGRVMTALKAKNMLDNSIILFMSDNGGATHGFNGNVASNWPLRGCKDTLWEGGVRAPGVIWSPLLQTRPRVHRGLVNVADWLPTILEAAGAPLEANRLDGLSQWSALQQKAKPPYQTMLHNIDPLEKIAALRHGDWKLVVGRTYNGHYDGFYGRLDEVVPYDLQKIRESQTGKAIADSPLSLPTDKEILELRAGATLICDPTERDIPHVIQVRHATLTADDLDTESGTAFITTRNNENITGAPRSNATDPWECQPHLSPCLFNLRDDPCETRNLAAESPKIMEQLRSILQTYRPVHPNNKREDNRSWPIHWNNTWTTWLDFVDPLA